MTLKYLLYSFLFKFIQISPQNVKVFCFQNLGFYLTRFFKAVCTGLQGDDI